MLNQSINQAGMLVTITDKSPVYVHPKRPQVRKPTTFLLWGDSSYHCTTMPPRIQVSHLWWFLSLRPVDECCSSKCSVTNVDPDPCLTHKCSRLRSKNHEYKVHTLSPVFFFCSKYSWTYWQEQEEDPPKQRDTVARQVISTSYYHDNLIRFPHDDCMSHVSS